MKKFSALELRIAGLGLLMVIFGASMMVIPADMIVAYAPVAGDGFNIPGGAHYVSEAESRIVGAILVGLGVVFAWMALAFHDEPNKPDKTNT